ncbi:hypothetical protein GCK72_006514 [Caenorhabditis remanei]|uniref:F-box domain-containing protein n=1 Tax=Caenorhabditis remanei TaxID=31234 RepID=A0A6A5HIY0_CAERE|nr:hypothetical protein GCK72_006514 [Caenorhabditis remanei]KAF1766557.1 hypothetical protein GCK72_006514 [Caenorhabditis remanei]
MALALWRTINMGPHGEVVDDDILTMRILNFPILVYENILKHLKPSELLLLSFCSLRTRALVSRMRHTPTYTVFVLNRPEEMNYALVNEPEKEEIVITWNWNNEKMGGVRTERIKSKYIDLECRITFKKNSNTPILWCSFENQSSRKRFATALHSHMCEVFRVEPEMQFKLSLDYMNELPYTNTVRDVTLLDTTVNSRIVDEFFEKFHVTRALFSKSYKRNNPLKDSCKFHQINNLFIDCSSWIDGSYLLKFDCQNLVAIVPSVRENSLIKFVNQWLEGKYTKLRTMAVLLDTDVDAPIVLNQFSLAPWNAEEDKINYDLPVHDYCKRLFKELNDMDRSGVLRRQSDGLRAVMRGKLGQFLFHKPMDEPFRDIPSYPLDESLFQMDQLPEQCILP